MKKLIIPFIILSLSGCSIDWNNEKDKRIVELENENLELKKQIDINNIEQQKLELEKEKLNFEKETKEQENYRLAKDKCEKIKKEYDKKEEEFINSCTGTGNDIQFCLNSDAGKAFYRYTSKEKLEECIIENK